MNQVYWMFDPESSEHTACVSSAEDVCVPENISLCLAGVGYEAYFDALPEHIREAVLCKHKVYPRADTMIRVVQAGGIASVTADAAMPAYVRQQVTGG
jgi:tRNA threonylcarbamoyladenosine biosynthesis protein TsaB